MSVRPVFKRSMLALVLRVLYKLIGTSLLLLALAFAVASILQLSPVLAQSDRDLGVFCITAGFGLFFMYIGGN